MTKSNKRRVISVRTKSVSWGQGDLEPQPVVGPMPLTDTPDKKTAGDQKDYGDDLVAGVKTDRPFRVN